MVFVRTLFLKDTRMVYLEDCSSLEECRSALTTSSGVPGDHLVFYNNGRRMMDEESPVDALATIDACLGLPGGKGGFGSMLRALGAQIEKTTNKEACRDLSGRRLRDINEETRLKNYVSNQAEREKEKKEKKEAKLNKLRKIVDPKCDGNGGKHEFHDPKYNKEREQATERVHEAMEAVFSKKDSSPPQSSSSSSSEDSKEPQPGGSGLAIKRKAEEKPAAKAGPSKPKKGLWVGDGLTESDLEDSSDEEGEGNNKK